MLTEAGKIQVRARDELTFTEHESDIDEPVILSVEFELEKDSPDAVLKRMRKAWILRKAAEPLSFQAAVRLFRNPPGQTAATLIDRAAMTKARVGGAELSERNSNYVVAHPGTTASRHPATGRSGPREGEGAHRGQPRTRAARLVSPRCHDLARTRRTAGGGTRRASEGSSFSSRSRWCAGVVWGIQSLGDGARREIAQRDRYATLFSDIECDAPPGYERRRLPRRSAATTRSSRRRFQSIDPDLEPKLSAAFAAHPWVAAVEDVSVEPENRIRVKLKFRVPALAVRHRRDRPIKVRVVDTHGVCSCRFEPTPRACRGSLTPVPAPTTPLRQAVGRRHGEAGRGTGRSPSPAQVLEKTSQGWRLTMKRSGRVAR